MKLKHTGGEGEFLGKEGNRHKKGRGLKRIWQKAARRIRRMKVFGLACLSLTFGGCVSMRAEQYTVPLATPIAVVDTVTPSGSMPPVTAPQKTVWLAPATDDPRLDSIFTKMKATETGRELLEYAAVHKVKIEMSDSKTMDSDPDDGIFIKGLNRYTIIQLNKEVTSDESIMLTLSHEIRHSWHKRTVAAGDLKLDPKRGWINDRVQEADCFAYEIHFGYEYEKATGVKLDEAARQGGYGSLATFYKNLRDSGVDTQDAYRQLVERAFLHTHYLTYDDDFLDRQIRNWQAVIDKPVLGILHTKAFDTPMSEADFAKQMRRVTTIGLDPDKNPSGLQAWKDADFASVDKTGGADPSDLVKLAKAEKNFEDAKVAWKNYWQEQLKDMRRSTQIDDHDMSMQQQYTPPNKLPGGPAP